MNRKLIFASVLGSSLEFYDFCLFGVLSPILSKVFFPADRPYLSLVFVFVIHAMSFLVRPLGGILFGYIGDKFGRRRSLSLTILLMAIPTVSIGLLPSYAQIGLAAPILLMFFRVMQGLFVGGEHNGAAIFLIEHAGEKKAGRAGAMILAGVSVGSFFALLAGSFFSGAEMPKWAWRVPFFIGALGGVVGHFIRKKLKETPEFLELQKRKALVPHPLKLIFREYKRPLLIAIGVGCFSGALGHSLSMYTSIYLTKVAHMAISHSMLYSSVGLVTTTILSLVAGYASDAIGQKPIMRVGAVATLFLSPIIYMMLLHKTQGSILGALVLLGVLTSAYNGPMHAFLNGIFPTHIKFTGLAFGYSIGMGVFAGNLPLISTMLIEHLDNKLAPALYLSFCALLGVGCIALSNKKPKKAFEQLRR